MVTNSSEITSRFLSVDVFRGVTIAGMVLVTNPGDWGNNYSQLRHADWHGLTPTDLIFPSFLLLVGISITFALGKRLERNSSSNVYSKIIKRSILLFTLGLLLELFPFYNFSEGDWVDLSTLRIMGVLQRIAICYFIAGIIFVRTNWQLQILIAVALLLIYWALMTLISVPGCETTTFNDKVCNLSAYIDRSILTEKHLFWLSKVYDPEGLLSTMSAVSTTLIGVLCGHWLRRKIDNYEKVAGLFFVGVLLITFGWIWSFWFPINKPIATGSYVLFSAGFGLCFLGFCQFLVDIKGYRSWAKPFVIFGVNAIALYLGAGILGKILYAVKLSSNGETISLQWAIYKNVFEPLASPYNASLGYAIAIVLLWLFVMWLLFRKDIYIRV